MPEGVHQIVGMNVVAYLLSFVTINRVRLAREGTLNKISQKAMQLRARMRRAGKAAAAEGAGFQFEVASIFLRQDVGGDFAGAEQTVL